MKQLMSCFAALAVGATLAAEPAATAFVTVDVTKPLGDRPLRRAEDVHALELRPFEHCICIWLLNLYADSNCVSAHRCCWDCPRWS